LELLTHGGAQLVPFPRPDEALGRVDVEIVPLDADFKTSTKEPRATKLRELGLVASLKKAVNSSKVGDNLVIGVAGRTYVQTALRQLSAHKKNHLMKDFDSLALFLKDTLPDSSHFEYRSDETEKYKIAMEAAE